MPQSSFRIKEHKGTDARVATGMANPSYWGEAHKNPGIEFVTDSLGMLKAISNGALDLFGVGREDIEGRQAQQFLGGDFAATMDQIRENGMFQSNLAFAQSLGSLEINVASGMKTVLCDFIHWPRLSEARTVYCVHSGAVIDEGLYTRRLEERGERFTVRKTF